MDDRIVSEDGKIDHGCSDYVAKLLMIGEPKNKNYVKEFKPP